MSMSTGTREPSPMRTSPEIVASNVVIERKPSFYRPVEDTPLQLGIYPATASSIYPSITSSSQCQAHLRLESNFSMDTRCDLFEVQEGSSGTWTTFDHKDDFSRYMRQPRSQNELSSLRVLFVYLEECIDTSFGCKVSMARDSVQEMLSTFDVNPHFVQFLLGKSDYLAPFQAQKADPDGNALLEFICQFPRWQIRGLKKELPCSIFLSYKANLQSTTYVVACEKDEPFINKARRTLHDTFCSSPFTADRRTAVKDPFLFASVLVSQSLLDGDTVIRGVRDNLNHQLNVVDALACKASDHASLSTVTKDLHYLAQDCEWVSATTDALSMITRRMFHAHTRMASTLSDLQSTNLEASLNYLCDAVEAQKRWILSYIACKEAARMHVYQLVTQQNSQTNTQIALATQQNSETNTNIAKATQENSETNTNIARATLEDSAVMKVIAIVTMVFLPSSVVTSFFGMVFFTSSDSSGGSDSTGRKLWVFWVVAIPLTCFVIAFSYLWWKWFDTHNKRKKIRSPSIAMSMAGDHLEEGNALPRSLLETISTLSQQISHTEHGSMTLVPKSAMGK